MVNSKMSELGQEIDHTRHMGKSPILGNGAAKAGMMVGATAANPTKAIPIDASSATLGISFRGIMDKHFSTDIDVAITDNALNNVLHPKSGDIASAFIVDPGADLVDGAPLTFSDTTAGSLKVVTTAAAHRGTLSPTTELDGNAGHVYVESIVAYSCGKVLNGATACLIRWK